MEILEPLGLFSGLRIPKHSTVIKWVRERRGVSDKTSRSLQRERKSPLR